MIQFENVSKRYANGHWGLTNVSFRLAPGEMAFLTGHSGAGKSTILKLILALERTQQGQITVSNQPFSQLRPRDIPALRRQIGIVLQNPHLIAHRTVFENIALPLIVAGIAQRECHSRVRAALDKVQLLSKEKLLPPMLSLGEQQRVSIARALVNRPTILLADEPTGNLDPYLSQDILQLFTEFNQLGTTVLLATHNLAQIASLPYRILVLKEGRLISGQ